MKIPLLFSFTFLLMYATNYSSVLKNPYFENQNQICTLQDSKTPNILTQEYEKEYHSIKAPPTAMKYIDTRALFARFKFYEPWYFMPTYYSFSDMYDKSHLTPLELKIQISFRLEMLTDVLCEYCTFGLGYTQKIYLQSYNGKESSPLRDIDLSPSVTFDYKRPLPIMGGKYGYITYLSTGYLHISNGEKEDVNPYDPRQNDPKWNHNFVRSKSLDRFIFETNYRYKDFNARVRAWLPLALVAFDGAKTNGDIWDYIGYGDVRFSYVYKNNLFEVYLNNIFNNYFTKDYWKWKGQLELGYSYGITKQFALYLQYVVGHGDSLYEYSLPVNRIGFGVRLRDF